MQTNEMSNVIADLHKKELFLSLLCSLGKDDFLSITDKEELNDIVYEWNNLFGVAYKDVLSKSLGVEVKNYNYILCRQHIVRNW